MPQPKRKLWALVMNAEQARILRGIGGGEMPDEEVLTAEAHKLRDIMADKPGRSFESHGGGRRSAVEYGGDPLTEERRVFAERALAVLEAHRRQGEVDGLVIYAEPDMLGLLRKEMPGHLKPLLLREVAKNLVHLSAQELPAVIAEDMGSRGDVR